jgi:hypothetical protein
VGVGFGYQGGVMDIGIEDELEGYFGLTCPFTKRELFCWAGGGTARRQWVKELQRVSRNEVFLNCVLSSVKGGGLLLVLHSRHYQNCHTAALVSINIIAIVPLPIFLTIIVITFRHYLLINQVVDQAEEAYLAKQAARLVLKKEEEAVRQAEKLADAETKVKKSEESVKARAQEVMKMQSTTIMSISVGRKISPFIYLPLITFELSIPL